ncbi:MAG TPA: hypothetical protein VHS53_01705 [Mucilaginibacter sp.]|nr:hypothetical protein [Mucilaginibacter sp.]
MRLVVLAAVILAIVAPKNTILSAAAEAKPVPVMVTGVPTGPADGLNELITGAWAKAEVNKKSVIRTDNNSFRDKG